MVSFYVSLKLNKCSNFNLPAIATRQTFILNYQRYKANLRGGCALFLLSDMVNNKHVKICDSKYTGVGDFIYSWNYNREKWIYTYKKLNFPSFKRIRHLSLFYETKIFWKRKCFKFNVTIMFNFIFQVSRPVPLLSGDF